MTARSGQPSATVDVVVVGAGLAGNAAALTAVERGASVCMLEKGEAFGGSSVKAGGGLVFAGTDLQKEAGVGDDPESLREAIFHAGQGRNDPAPVDVYVKNQFGTYEWFRRHGIGFSLAPANADVRVPRIHAAPQGQLTRDLHGRFVASPLAEFWTNTPARRLLRAQDGRVTGVEATFEGRNVSITARRGVILTSGGFSQSLELLQTYAPQWADAVGMGGAGNTGDGLRMALALGAQLIDMQYIEASFGASVNDFPGLPGNADADLRLLFPNAEGAIIVNSAGRRFVNESSNFKAIGRVCAGQPRGIAFAIFDQTVMSRSRTAPKTRDFKGALADGLIVEAPTVAALAQALGIEPSALEATIEAYNGFVRDGVDPEWGRPVGGADIAAHQIDTAPFFGYPCRAGLTSTFCGVKVDRRLRVIDAADQPINGLFAAGEIVGGLHGAGYLTGTGLGKAAVFGRVAGIEATAGVAPPGGAW